MSSYAGQTIDLFIMQGAAPAGMRRISTTLSSEDGGKIVGGVEKVAQSFLTRMMTSVGTYIGSPTVGTAFASSLRGTNLRLDSLQLIFTDAASDVLMQLNTEQAGLPDGERLASVELLSASQPDSTSYMFEVRLWTRAGTSTIVLMPITLVIK